MVFFAVIHTWMLWKGRGKPRKHQGFAALERFGKVGAYLQLELKQIWRNKYFKTMLALSIVILFILSGSDDFNQGEGMGMLLSCLSWRSSFRCAYPVVPHILGQPLF